MMNEETVITRILPILNRLVTDTSEHVRISFAGVVSKLSSVLKKDKTIQFLLPLILTLLRDEVSEVPISVIAFILTSYKCIVCFVEPIK